MNKQQAIDLVRNTLESPFEKARFIGFIKNLLNEIEEAPFTYQGNYIPDAYKPYVSTLERVGKYTDGKNNIDILIVHLKRETSIERARTMQRNFIAWYLNGSRGGDQKDAALVAFVSPSTEEWRFSLVKMEYRFEEKDGKVKVKEEFTPARRWSFLVGTHEKSHTAQSRLVPTMVDDKNNPTLTELEEAFNIEKVTKEFFEKYRDLFIRTKDELDKAIASNPKTKADFESKGIDTVNLAKKLLGQIIFLYYLQKKGWFGVPRDGEWGQGSKNFLRELFAKKKDNENFFNDILEHLFYDALRNDRSHDDHYYGRFDCKIPFLNGGLFDPMNNYDWVRADILLPDSLFSNKNKTKEGDEGDGILDVFDRYNFTVREDEPFEKEVAIDPELLGKAYEKFNAIRPDNYDEFLKALKSGKKGDESKFNKQYGVYYTPREIVHYMCQQSLINYLYSELNPNVVYQSLGDDQLDMFGNAAKGGQMDMTVEHHPMAEIAKEAIALLIQHGEDLREHEAQAAEKETKTYSPIIHESIRNNASLIDEKLAAIKVCDPAVGSGAFPVGMMSEIVRARDVLTTFMRPDRSSRPVRSVYQFKRECIENSLYGVDIDAGAVEIAKLRLWLSLIVDEDDIQNIKPLPNLDYKIVCGNSLLGFPHNWGSPLEKEIEALKHNFFNETNPKIKNDLKVNIDDKIAYRYQNSLKTFGYKVNFDFKTVFSEVFHDRSGFDIVIANPPYVSAWSMQKDDPQSRSEIVKALTGYTFLRGHWDLFIAFIAKGHQLLKRNGCLSFIVPNPILREKYATGARKFLLEETWVDSILEFNESNVFEEVSRRTTVLVVKNIKVNGNYQVNVFSNPREGIIQLSNIANKNSWLNQPKHTFLIKGNNQEDELIQKIGDSSLRIGNFFYVNYGAQVSSKKQGGYKKNEVVTSNKKGNAKKFYEGKDVQRWHLRYRDLWLDYRVKDMYGPRDPKLFEQDKIAIRKVSDKNHVIAATFDETKMYTDDGVVLIVPYSTLNNTNLQASFEGFEQMSSELDLKYVLAHLLSKLEGFYFRKRFATESLQASTSHTYPASVRGLVIKALPNKEQQPFIKLVERILAAKRANPQADTSELEREIDQLVYQLYGLTEEEIAIVEGQEPGDAAPAAKPKNKKVEKNDAKPTQAPAQVKEEPSAAKTSDYGLYKCSECGSMVMGFTKEEHVREVHGGKPVEWKKMSGG
jgi:hypothetical protein